MNTFTATDLSPHPEGGRFKEVHRSKLSVTNQAGQQKSALTHIYFSLNQGEVSRFHRVAQEEVWNLYKGKVRIWLLDPETLTITSTELSEANNCYCTVIPPGFWQATEPLSPEALVGCSVAPGFDFSDFELITPEHPLCDPLRKAKLSHLL
ncbi:cupin domain-containing protein [Kiritimatiellota bacterium B12222]|nr:cupin domain-containing protein [Kiritimatiellota bacterium B12222]